MGNCLVLLAYSPATYHDRVTPSSRTASFVVRLLPLSKSWERSHLWQPDCACWPQLGDEGLDHLGPGLARREDSQGGNNHGCSRPRSLGLPLRGNYMSFGEDARTGPPSPAVGAMRIQACLNVSLDVMLRRDLSGDKGGKRTIYRRGLQYIGCRVALSGGAGGRASGCGIRGWGGAHACSEGAPIGLERHSARRMDPTDGGGGGA